ncbi:MAG: hypothetical protein BRC25_02070 [Parcubacteria group bacterium SW_6_46_9]|nr:MAG: hypothetical protein BRC25_02070 [Parcubacteria group bacterium SW_6_46_9]
MWPIYPVLATVSEGGRSDIHMHALIVMSEVCHDSLPFSKEDALRKELKSQYPDLDDPQIHAWKHLHPNNLPEEIASCMDEFNSIYRSMSQEEQKTMRSVLSWLVTYALAEKEEAEIVATTHDDKPNLETGRLGQMLRTVATHNILGASHTLRD